eukprot:scaffold251867_cov20-Tisochrysis_lutea.AAC.1
MSVVRCGEIVVPTYTTCVGVFVPSRLSMSAYGGLKLFIELGINEATNVGVVDAAFGDAPAFVKRQLRVDKNCQFVECYFAFVVHPAVIWNMHSSSILRWSSLMWMLINWCARMQWLGYLFMR